MSRLSICCIIMRSTDSNQNLIQSVPHLCLRPSFLSTFKRYWISRPPYKKTLWPFFSPPLSSQFDCIRILFVPSTICLSNWLLNWIFWQHSSSSNNGPSPSSSSSSCSPLTSAATYSRRLLGRGSWFGDSVLDDSPRDATASTRGPCKLLRVEQRDFRSLWQVLYVSS